MRRRLRLTGKQIAAVSDRRKSTAVRAAQERAVAVFATICSLREVADAGTSTSKPMKFLRYCHTRNSASAETTIAIGNPAGAIKA